VTTNGGAFVGAPAGSQGVSRVDVGDLAQISNAGEGYRRGEGAVCFYPSAYHGDSDRDRRK